MNQIPAQIRNAPVLRRLANNDLLDLIHGCSLRSFVPGEIMVREGGTPVEVFLLLSGRVSVQRVDSTGRGHVLALRGPGEWIGETGIIRDARHTATVEAEIPTRVLGIPKEAFSRVILASRGAAGELLEIVTNRLVESDGVRLRRRQPDAKAGRGWEGQVASDPDGRAAVGESPSFHAATRSFQAQLVRQTLDQADGNVSEAARRLRIARSYLYKLLGSRGVSRRARVKLGDPAPMDSLLLGQQE